ncbi:hypothetical protein GAY33_11995 [Azospirillum brasilense]|uniref:hypothetical protein n=1 Tax=Azospirillum argentinense TaxID=2970906 RepID=UPI0019093098|nr:hypothetical protein [Azospirillum argentinense]MBK3799946.1 hypothetical protein [Azospirillum argentinense]
MTDLTSGRTAMAQVFVGIDPAHIPGSDSLWAQVNDLVGGPDRGWHPLWLHDILNWEAEQRPDAHVFSVFANGQLQGVAMVCARTPGPDSVLFGDTFIHIDRLASAPWNRKGARQSADWQDVEREYPGLPWLEGIGQHLVGYCVKLSVQTGHKGRVAGIALPESLGFYQSKCNFECVGDPKADGSRWVRLTAGGRREALRHGARDDGLEVVGGRTGGDQEAPQRGWGGRLLHLLGTPFRK